jgi:hypothetical protein
VAVSRAALAAGVLALLAPAAFAKDLAGSLRGAWRVETASMFPGGVLPVDKKAPAEVQEDQLEEALEDVPAVAFEFTADTMTLVLGAERHASAFELTRTEGRTVHFEARERGQAPGAPAERMRATFVDDDTIELSKAGDPQVLRLKRAR